MVGLPGAPWAPPRRLLIDTDPGIDDALALLLAFRTPGVTVEALTTVAGNVSVELATRNVARILGVARPARAPVIGVGAAGPRTRVLVTAEHVHGPDGLGGVTELLGPDRQPRFPEVSFHRHPGGAAELIVECARRWGGELVVVALGPLTNLAAAVDRDVAALRQVRQVVAMAGAVAGGGNVTAAAEFNAYVDPEAAAVTLGAGLPLTLVPLDVTRQVVWTGDRISELGGGDDPVVDFATEVARGASERAVRIGEDGVTLHDPLAVAVALDPGLVELVEAWVTVETTGMLTRGVTVVDRRRRSTEPPSRANCRVALGVDAVRALRVFEEALWGRVAGSR